MLKNCIPKYGFILVQLVGFCEELSGEQLDVGDVPTDLVDGIVLFGLFEVEAVHVVRPYVLLANYT